MSGSRSVGVCVEKLKRDEWPVAVHARFKHTYPDQSCKDVKTFQQAVYA